MADVTEEDLQKMREGNQSLRQEIAAVKADAAETAQAKNREIEAANLMAENARLEAQLEAAKRDAQRNSEDEKNGPLASVTEQLRAAQEPKTAPGVTVDTNKESEKKQQPMPPKPPEPGSAPASANEKE